MTQARLRVDTVPWALRPVYLFLSFAVVAPLVCVALALRASCRVEYVGGTFEPASPVVFCCWHDSFIPLVCGRVGQRLTHHAWMNHPAYFMKPVHLLLRFLGVGEVVLGSSGNGGRAAARRLIEAISGGASTLVYVDGPAGPARSLKKGALHLAQQSGAPVVAVRISTPHAWVFTRTWDSKRIPRPFSLIRFEFSPPMQVDASNLEAVADTLSTLL